MTLDLLTNLLRSQPENDELQLRAAIIQSSLGDAQGAAGAQAHLATIRRRPSIRHCWGRYWEI
jgi:hypothetical protein